MAGVFECMISEIERDSFTRRGALNRAFALANETKAASFDEMHSVRCS